MSVGPIRLNGVVDPRQAYGAGQTAARPQGTSFSSQLEKALQQVDRLQDSRDEMVAGAVTGQVSEVHDVMVAAEEAQLSFELMLEVRNRLLESYNEIMSLQI